MKKSNVEKKLVLNKRDVAHLDITELHRVRGGFEPDVVINMPVTQCPNIHCSEFYETGGGQYTTADSEFC